MIGARTYGAGRRRRSICLPGPACRRALALALSRAPATKSHKHLHLVPPLAATPGGAGAPRTAQLRARAPAGARLAVLHRSDASRSPIMIGRRRPTFISSPFRSRSALHAWSGSVVWIGFDACRRLFLITQSTAVKALARAHGGSVSVPSHVIGVCAGGLSQIKLSPRRPHRSRPPRSGFVAKVARQPNRQKSPRDRPRRRAAVRRGRRFSADRSLLPRCLAPVKLPPGPPAPAAARLVMLINRAAACARTCLLVGTLSRSLRCELRCCRE